MAARVVEALSSSYWAESKPADYKAADLDKALKTWEGLAGKTVVFAKDLIPSLPKSKVRDIDSCITKLKAAIADLEKGKTMLDQWISALKAVQAAAGKAAGDLSKLKSGKDVSEEDKLKYQRGVNAADSIGSAAGSALKDYA